jgi:hypothetical protein
MRINLAHYVDITHNKVSYLREAPDIWYTYKEPGWVHVPWAENAFLEEVYQDYLKEANG